MTSLKDHGYEDVKVIGRGQYGKAHLVTSGKEQNYFIAKTIDLTCLSKKERETALQEVELLRRLDHPNIVEYRDNFFMGDILVIVMQYCEGGDLATYIKDMARKKTRIHESQIMNYFVQIIQALQYIHGERILHRDLKTSNLFLMKSKSVVKLGDFGISRVLEGSTLAAITVVGTPYYMSPEVCENKPYTFKSDVWSLGCVLYELCMLKHAFSADNLLGLVYKIVSDKYEPIPKMYSQALNALIQRMLEKKADVRPDVKALLADDYVRKFMNEYVRTRGQCAVTTASNATTSGAPGSRPNGGGSSRSGPSGGSASSARPRGAAGGRGPSTGAAAGGDAGAGGLPAGSGEQRPVKTRPPRATRQGSGGNRMETPKEAAARRKREAADKEAERLKAAARQSTQNKTVARRMKEAEFHTTRFGGGMLAAGSGSPASAVTPEAASTAASTAADGAADSASATDPDEDEVLEDISECGSSEEYEEDFYEDDFCSEEEAIYSEVEEELHIHSDIHVGGALSTVREEQDWTRVMSNYEQDLARAGASPPPRRTSSDRVAGHAPAAMASTASLVPCLAQNAPAVAAGAEGSAALDIRSRAKRVHEELVEKMGADTFKIAFDFLYKARSCNTDERTVRRELEALVGKDTYKKYCFDVDQLVFQQMCYGGKSP